MTSSCATMTVTRWWFTSSTPRRTEERPSKIYLKRRFSTTSRSHSSSSTSFVIVGVPRTGTTKLQRMLVFAAYGGPALSGMIFTLAPANYLPSFYVEEKGLSLGAVGLILFAARLWDAVIDPLIGAWSDRRVGRFGRRKLWICASAPPLIATRPRVTAA